MTALDPLVHASPVLNTFLIAALGLYVLVRSSTWTGAPQDVRITRLEKSQSHNERRFEQLEGNTHRIGSDFDNSITKLADQIRSMEDHLYQMKQQLQSFERRFSSMGCGHPECPRQEELRSEMGGK